MPAPQMPPAESHGFVPTLNRYGYMSLALDPFMSAFVDFCATAAKPCLDIGAAYGNATLAALEKGATIIANDIEKRHLDILLDRVPAASRGRLITVCGAFPEEIYFPAQSIGAILIARVAHFFDGPRVETAARKAFDWLAPGGKMFLTAETPYLSNWQSFIPVYEARKAQGARWPGYVDDVMRYAPERGKNLPPTMLFLEPDVLRRTFTEAGYKVELTHTFARPDFPPDLHLDGRESVGIIAVK